MFLLFFFFFSCGWEGTSWLGMSEIERKKIKNKDNIKYFLVKWAKSFIFYPKVLF